MRDTLPPAMIGESRASKVIAHAVLIIGVLASMFTAITLSRTLLTASPLGGPSVESQSLPPSTLPS